MILDKFGAVRFNDIINGIRLPFLEFFEQLSSSALPELLGPSTLFKSCFVASSYKFFPFSFSFSIFFFSFFLIADEIL